MWKSKLIARVHVRTKCSRSIVTNAIKLDIIAPRSIPGLNSSKKLWWAKEITPDLHVAGGLTARQMKYAFDGGFKTIISLFAENSQGEFGGEKLVTAQEATSIARIAGLQFESILRDGDDWVSLNSVKKLSEAVSGLEKPILLYSRQPERIAFVTLMHLAALSKKDKSLQPRVNSEKIYKMSVLMGMDFTQLRTKTIIAEITGEPVVEDPPKPNATPSNWLEYWLAHPVYKNWFTAGQIRRGDLKVLEDIGFKSVINMRQGTTLNNKPSQETVNLINIKDSVTYDENNKPTRQLDTTLRKLVIGPSRENAYVCPTSTVNYEKCNEGEFGDNIGHNEGIERAFFKGSKLKYYHLPLDLFVKYSPEVFQQYKDMLLNIGGEGPVLFHCAIGKRAALMGVLAAALQYGKDLNWALQRINELGFKVNGTDSFTDVYNMYSGWLKPKQ